MEGEEATEHRSRRRARAPNPKRATSLLVLPLLASPIDGSASRQACPVAGEPTLCWGVAPSSHQFLPSKLQAGLVTVSSASQQHEQDPDLLALQRLPHVSPLVKPPDALAAIFSRSRQPELPSLHSAAVQQLCRDYAAYCRDAATPLCEGQKTLAKKMCGLEALCARILYLLALRFNTVKVPRSQPPRRSPPACSGLPSRPKRSAFAAEKLW